MVHVKDRMNPSDSSELIKIKQSSENRVEPLQKGADAGRDCIRIPHNLKVILNYEAAEYSINTQHKFPIGDMLFKMVSEYLKQNKIEAYNYYKDLKLI
ncbi:MAG: hypothetical protein IJ543_04330 [Bacteroidales bacterium]|nr:hypothetical protein [Bacteroidales bacterium]